MDVPAVICPRDHGQIVGFFSVAGAIFSDKGEPTLDALVAPGRNDLRGTGGDSLLAGMFLAPLVRIVMVRFDTPPVTRMLGEDSAIIVGGVTALVVLEERDAHTLAAVRITPASLGRYICVVPVDELRVDHPKVHPRNGAFTCLVRCTAR